MIEIDGSLLICRFVSLGAMRYGAAREGRTDESKRMRERELRLGSIDWVWDAQFGVYVSCPNRPITVMGGIDAETWEHWWMPDDLRTRSVEDPQPAVALNLGLFDGGERSESSEIDESPDAVIQNYHRIMKVAGRSVSGRVTYPDALSVVRAGALIDPPKRSAKATDGSAMKRESDRILRTANAPMVAPGQSWVDGSGSVRYTSWCWIPEVNRWSYRLAMSLGVYAEINRKWTYVGEDHLYNLDSPDHELHDVWLRERRAFLDLVGHADEYTAHL